MGKEPVYTKLYQSNGEAMYPIQLQRESKITMKRQIYQAFFTAFGNIGWALTPVMVVPFIIHYGLELTPVFTIPGIIVAIILWIFAPKVPSKAKTVPVHLLSILRTSWRELTKVIIVVALRSLAYFGLIAFLPLYLQATHVSFDTSSWLLFIMLFAGAIGGLAGGYLSDLFGRKLIIVVLAEFKNDIEVRKANFDYFLSVYNTISHEYGCRDDD